MALSEKECFMPSTGPEIYRVIDDGDCILTTLDPRKALVALMELIDKHDVTSCWAESETLK